MINVEMEIKKYGANGDKTGWTYVEIPEHLASQLKPDNARSFRVRGQLDKVAIQGVALIPIGGGDFILPLNAVLRRQLGKSVGDPLHLSVQEDTEFKIEVPLELEMTLQYSGENLFEHFMELTPSHRGYFIKYINEAKTEPTRIKRLAMTAEAMELGLDYGAMIRRSQSKNKTK